jgi:hypothetical protein
MRLLLPAFLCIAVLAMGLGQGLRSARCSGTAFHEVQPGTAPMRDVPDPDPARRGSHPSLSGAREADSEPPFSLPGKELPRWLFGRNRPERPGPEPGSGDDSHQVGSTSRAG